VRARSSSEPGASRESAEEGRLRPPLGSASPRDAAAALAHESYESGRTIRELYLEKQVLPKEKLDELLDPIKMTGK
jgi:fumarate hydratase class II